MIAQRAIALVISQSINVVEPPAPTSASSAERSANPAMAPEDGDESIANIIKMHPQYEALISTAFHGRDFWHKVAAVLHCSDRPLTAGQISKAMEDLAIKADRSNVRKCLRTHLRDLVKKQVGNGHAYKLTSSADANFARDVSLIH